MKKNYLSSEKNVLQNRVSISGGDGGGHRTEEVIPPPSEGSPPPMSPPLYGEGPPPFLKIFPLREHLFFLEYMFFFTLRLILL